MAASASAKGDSFKAEGNKALNRTTIFGFGKQQKYEDAADAFTKAGNAYKLANLWQSAGDAFLQAAEAHTHTDNNIDALNCTVEAANSYKKVNPDLSLQTFLKIIDMYNEQGRFGVSAKYYKEIAEMYEAANDTSSALEYYQSAADFFSNDNKRHAADQCMLKVAAIASEKNDLIRAATVYENCGKESLKTTLGAYSAKGYFFQCLLCHLAGGDRVAVDIKLEEFKNLDYTFPKSRECGFVEQLLQALDASSEEDYSTACADYDKISPLDPWKTSMLLKGKHSIASADNEDEPDLT